MVPQSELVAQLQRSLEERQREYFRSGGAARSCRRLITLESEKTLVKKLNEAKTSAGKIPQIWKLSV